MARRSSERLAHGTGRDATIRMSIDVPLRPLPRDAPIPGVQSEVRNKDRAMPAHAPPSPVAIALIDGNATVRRERQLMLRSEHFDVRAYATCASALADADLCAGACLIVEDAMPASAGAAVVHAMRSRGWHGTAILLGGAAGADTGVGASARNRDVRLPAGLPDRALVDAVRAAGRMQVAVSP